jgi:hypothetical protein
MRAVAVYSRGIRALTETAIAVAVMQLAAIHRHRERM